MGKSDRKKGDTDIAEYIALQQELIETRKKYGIEEKEGRLSHMISSFFERRENRQKIRIRKKKYLLLAVFTGWMGGHRFYARHYSTAVLYLVLFWTGFPLAMTIIDLLSAIPMEADEEGMILM